MPHCLAMSTVDAIAIAVVAVMFVGVVPAIMLAVAYLSGWRTAARQYPAQPSAADADRGLGSIEFAPLCGYNNCILWRADDDYLHIRIMFPFNMFHPPMSIPWIEITSIKTSWSGARIAMPKRTWTVSKKMVRRELENRELLATAPR
jgi:hypothetical protein